MDEQLPLDFNQGQHVAYLARISKLGKDDNEEDRKEAERLAAQDNSVLEFLNKKEVILNTKNHYKEIGSAYLRPIVERQILQDILIAAKNKEFAVLTFFKIDRLDRNDPIMCVLYIRQLNEAGCKVYSYIDGWLDCSSPLKQLMVLMQLTMAKQESENISIRVKAKFAQKIKDAGGDKTKAKLGGWGEGIILSPEAIKFARHKQNIGMSLEAIAKLPEINCSIKVLRRNLKNNKYI